MDPDVNHEDLASNVPSEGEPTPKQLILTKPKVRNALGGKNPQNVTKGKSTSKNMKGTATKEKKYNQGEGSKETEASRATHSSNNNIGKEKLPNDEQALILAEKKRKEEQQMLDYMKRMYQTHGVNLLNKFRSEESIRTALGQFDENDKRRALELQKKASFEGCRLVKAEDQQQQKTILIKENQLNEGGSSPMEDIEELATQHPYLS